MDIIEIFEINALHGRVLEIVHHMFIMLILNKYTIIHIFATWIELIQGWEIKNGFLKVILSFYVLLRKIPTPSPKIITFGFVKDKSLFHPEFHRDANLSLHPCVPVLLLYYDS